MKIHTITMKHFAWLLPLAAVAVLGSCTNAKDPYNPDNGGTTDTKTGKLSLGMVRNDEFLVVGAQSVAPLSKAGGDVNLDNFTVKITNKTSGQVFDKWGNKYAEVKDQILTIPSGSYTVDAYNFETPEPAAWETPWYRGTNTFSVRISELTEASVECRLANTKVTVSLADGLKEQVNVTSIAVTNSQGVNDPYGGTLVYNQAEIDAAKAGYFTVPDSKQIYVTIYYTRIADNQPQSQRYIIKDVEAAQWHKINFNFNTNGTGSATVTVDHTVIEKNQEVIIPDGDDVVNGGPNNGNWEDDDPTNPDPDPTPDPTELVKIVGSNYVNAADGASGAFNVDEPVTVTDPSETETILDMQILADKGIEKLQVTIESEALTDDLLGMVGLTKSFDLAAIDPVVPPEGEVTLAGTLINLGLLKAGDPLKGKTAYTFSIGSFMYLLTMAEANRESQHKFIITLVDAEGNSLTKTLTINLIQTNK